ncbi:MAG: RNA methyltransferase [Bacteroidales bacterium]|nr:RNA methyltransferase [Bacteroidales bacterium]
MSKFEIIAKTFEGLENVLAEELKNLGAEQIEIKKRAVGYYGDKKLLYASNYCLRTALNILVPINKFQANNEIELYKGISKINWENYLSLTDTFSINSTVFSDYFKHSKYVSLKVKDAIVDQFRRRKNKRPNIDVVNPDIKINIHIYKDTCTISLDSSGEPLFKRGYRISGYVAPINEVLAAGMILHTGWEGNCDFIDPMCGSGTIVIEAAMIAHKIPPGVYRKKFGFENWKDFDSELLEIIAEENDISADFKYKIFGSDVSKTAIELSDKNIKNASLKNKINLNVNAFENSKPTQDSGIIVTNPPYGERMKKIDLDNFYKQIGDQLKKEYSGFDAWIISGNMEALKNIGLHTSRKIKLFNGPLECRFNKFSIYEGSKKARKLD